MFYYLFMHEALQGSVHEDGMIAIHIMLHGQIYSGSLSHGITAWIFFR